ncbi:MAG: hypothetical protein K0U47_03070 [Epsilonproteobacteria bacterium]|nr:hypothetical protein [Campylobacterota bacterium]
MNYIIEIKLEHNRTRKYPITAVDEKEAIEKMKLRLLPFDRERFTLLSITPDTSKVIDDIYGTFLE